MIEKTDALLFVGTVQEFHPKMQLFTVMCTLVYRLITAANDKIDIINKSSVSPPPRSRDVD